MAAKARDYATMEGYIRVGVRLYTGTTGDQIVECRSLQIAMQGKTR